jgi:hypothetical protein
VRQALRDEWRSMVFWERALTIGLALSILLIVVGTVGQIVTGTL